MLDSSCKARGDSRLRVDEDDGSPQQLIFYWLVVYGFEYGSDGGRESWWPGSSEC